MNGLQRSHPTIDDGSKWKNYTQIICIAEL